MLQIDPTHTAAGSISFPAGTFAADPNASSTAVYTAFGYWRVDPASGATAALGTAEPVLDDGTAHAWRTVVDPRDPKPALSALSGEPLPDEIVWRDVTTGVETVWFYHPGFNVAIAGVLVDGGVLAWTEPSIAATDPGGHEYWLVTAPGSSTLVAHIEYGGQTMADAHGVWMGGNYGVYLFTSGGAVHHVFGTAGQPASSCV